MLLWWNLIPGVKFMGKTLADFNYRENGHPITFQYLGGRGYAVTLFASPIVSRRKWIEHIEAQKSVLKERSSIFTRSILCDGFFNSGNRVSCLVPIGKPEPAGGVGLRSLVNLEKNRLW